MMILPLSFLTEISGSTACPIPCDAIRISSQVIVCFEYLIKLKLAVKILQTNTNEHYFKKSWHRKSQPIADRMISLQSAGVNANYFTSRLEVVMADHIKDAKQHFSGINKIGFNSC